VKDYVLILNGSPCHHNLYQGGPTSFKRAQEEARSCSFSSHCGETGLRDSGRQCAMLFGTQVARNALRNGCTIDVEMESFLSDLSPKISWVARNGIIWSQDGKDFEVIADVSRGVKMIRWFAEMLLEGYDLETAGSFWRRLAATSKVSFR